MWEDIVETSNDLVENFTEGVNNAVNSAVEKTKDFIEDPSVIFSLAAERCQRPGTVKLSISEAVKLVRARFCPDEQCLFSGILPRFYKATIDYINAHRPAGAEPARLPEIYGVVLGDAEMISHIEAQLNHGKAAQHLSAVRAYLLSIIEPDNPMASTTSATLYDLSPLNPFYRYLAEGVSEDLVDHLLDIPAVCSMVEFPVPPEEQRAWDQWAWERPAVGSVGPRDDDVCTASATSMMWDRIFMTNLVFRDLGLSGMKSHFVARAINDIYQDVYGRAPEAAELAEVQAAFANAEPFDAVKAEVIDQAIHDIYQDVYRRAPRAIELAEARAAFANGDSFDAILAKVSGRRDAVLMLLSQYLMGRQ